MPVRNRDRQKEDNHETEKSDEYGYGGSYGIGDDGYS